SQQHPEQRMHAQNGRLLPRRHRQRPAFIPRLDLSLHQLLQGESFVALVPSDKRRTLALLGTACWTERAGPTQRRATGAMAKNRGDFMATPLTRGGDVSQNLSVAEAARDLVECVDAGSALAARFATVRYSLRSP